MKTITFTIKGNQTKDTGNPYGYTRVLSHGWREDATKYMNWCKYVRMSYYLETGYGKTMKWRDLAKLPKPFTTSKDTPARMDIEIFYANDSRADTDNVYKGIADALFENDKYIMTGSFVGKISPDKVGRVEVKLTFNE